MSTRSKLYALIAILSAALVLVCLGIAALVGYGYVMPLLTRTTVNPINRIAFVDNDSNIQLIDPDGAHPLALTTDASESNQRFYIFPTWSPDNRQIAFIGTHGADPNREGALYAMPPQGGKRVTVFKSALTMPFYLYWSPDSRRIGFLAQTNTDMSFMLGQADGTRDAATIETGSPFYWAWSPNSQALLMHVGGSRHDSSDAQLKFWREKEASTSKSLARGPSDFEAPQYSPDGTQILYAALTDTGDDALYVADAQDTHARTLTSFQGRIAFAWSSDGKKIGWIVTDPDAGLPNLGPLTVSDADGNHPQKLVTDNVVAFYWSPDSQSIAYLTFDLGDTQGCVDQCIRVPGLSAPLHQDTTVHLRWKIANIATGKISTLVTFDPTESFLSVLPYFDQYARSMTFWSPDSQNFVYTQTETDGSGTVWVADVTGHTPARKIGEGTLGVWSWK